MALTLVTAAATAFNLVCSVQYAVGPLSSELINSVEKGTPTTLVLRVDLGRLRWCGGDCLSTNAIVALNDAEIIFQRQPIGESSTGTGSEIKVNRESGLFTHVFIAKNGATSLGGGKCTPAAFTGMPQPKF